MGTTAKEGYRQCCSETKTHGTQSHQPHGVSRPGGWAALQGGRIPEQLLGLWPWGWGVPPSWMVTASTSFRRRSRQTDRKAKIILCNHNAIRPSNQSNFTYHIPELLQLYEQYYEFPCLHLALSEYSLGGHIIAWWPNHYSSDFHNTPREGRLQWHDLICPAWPQRRPNPVRGLWCLLLTLNEIPPLQHRDPSHCNVAFTLSHTAHTFPTQTHIHITLPYISTAAES